MTWRNLFRRQAEPEQPDQPRTPVEPDPDLRTPPGAHGRVSPQLQQMIERRTGAPSIADPAQRKLAGLRRQRQAILFDIEQGELAASPDNPWTQRIALLTEAMTTVTDDLQRAKQVEPGPYAPVPATPIVIGTIDPSDAAAVSLAIGGERFTYSEDPDWAERGHQVTRSELVRRSGDPAALVPANTPEDLREPLREHLTDSLFVLASDLRDRALDGEPLPGSPTLADLARPCTTCGGWTDWRGTCQACARRNATIASLRREEQRLLDERSREADERHRLVEGLPLARKRLRDVEADLAALGDTFR